MGQWLPKGRRAVIVLCGLTLIAAAVFGVTAMLPVGSASGELAAEPIRPRRSPLQHTVLIFDEGVKHFIQRQGFEGNREFYIVTSIDGNDTTGDEVSIYEPGTFSGASQLLAGEKVKITDPAGKSRPGYYLAGGHVLGWQGGSGLWAVIRSRSPGGARQRLLDLAGNVVGTEPTPLRAPFSVRYVPAGFVPTHASRDAGDDMGAWLFGLSKGPVREEAQLTFTVKRRLDMDDTRTRDALGEPDSRANGRQLWYVKTGTPGFSVPPGSAEIVLRNDGCYGHIRIADVSLIPRAEQGKILEGFTLGLCADTRGWAYPLAR